MACRPRMLRPAAPSRSSATPPWSTSRRRSLRHAAQDRTIEHWRLGDWRLGDCQSPNLQPPNLQLQCSALSELLSILVPVYNEARTVSQVIHRLLEIPLPVPREIVVIND